MVVRDGELACVACQTSACGKAHALAVKLRCAAHDLVRHVGGHRQQSIYTKLPHCQNALCAKSLFRHTHLFLVMHP